MNSTPIRQPLFLVVTRPRSRGNTLLQHAPLVAWTAVLPPPGRGQNRPAALVSGAARAYARLAQRAASWQPKALAQDRAFARANPDTYARIARHLKTRYPCPERLLRTTLTWLTHKLAAAGISALLSARVSHAFGAYTKTRAKGLPLADLHDLVGIRIIVGRTSDCYRALETVYSLWDPVRGDFDDYVGRPKSNGYQSLHTTLQLGGEPALEIQIRTRAMHRRAETGPAAHWRYKAQAGLS